MFRAWRAVLKAVMAVAALPGMGRHCSKSGHEKLRKMACAAILFSSFVLLFFCAPVFFVFLLS
jgi:surfactin synthase thioesterase subunit